MAVFTINDGVWKTEITYTGAPLVQMNHRVIELLDKWERFTMFAPVTHFIWDAILPGPNTWKFEITRSDGIFWKQQFFGVPGDANDPDFNFTFALTDKWSRREASPYRSFREAVLALVFQSSTTYATKITIDKL